MVLEAGRSVQLLPVPTSTLGGWYPDARRARCSVATAIVARGMFTLSSAKDHLVPTACCICRDENCSTSYVRPSVRHLRIEAPLHLSLFIFFIYFVKTSDIRPYFCAVQGFSCHNYTNTILLLAPLGYYSTAPILWRPNTAAHPPPSSSRSSSLPS